jgi:hypothetical protein
MSRKLNHIALCSVLFVGAAIVNAQQIHVWDLALTDQAGQMTVYNPDRDDAQFGTPVRSGNLDGDAFDDLVISAMAADGPPGGERRENAGEVAVYFSPGHIGGQVDLREKSPGVITIYGEQPRSIFGIKSEVADVDGNGSNDLLVGAFYADGVEREDAGKLYFFTSELLSEIRAGTGMLDLAEPWPPGVGVVIGPDHNSRLGVWMAAGDVNGDGVADVVVGADQASGFGSNAPSFEAGRVYVLYGPLAAGERIDLNDSTRPMSVIYGIDALDHAGSTVASDDINGDGFDDVIIGAAALGTLRNAYNIAGGAGDGPNNERHNAGEVYVVFGRPDLPRDIDLNANPPQDLLVVYGADGGENSPDRLGEEIVTADINGDGLADMLLGAYRADGPGNSRPDAGDVCVVYGARDLPGRVIDLVDPPEGTMLIYGARDQAIAGDAIAAGDIHGDGYDDLFIGVPGDDGPLDRPFSGGIVVIAGGPNLPAVVDLAAPSVPVVWIQAPDNFDFSAYWAAAGDFDGDGSVDIMPNGMAGDGPDNRRNNAGEVHVVSGRLVAEILGGAVQLTAIAEEALATVPAQASLGQNYPNPFNSRTTIEFSLAVDADLHLAIYDVTGQQVATLVEGWRTAGVHTITWDGRDSAGEQVASGVYLYRLAIGRKSEVRRLLLLK